DEFTLEEVTVTAQKREENQQKVAIAMEVFSGDNLRELGRNDISSILENISNVLFYKDSDGVRASIRSITDDKPEFYSMPATAPIVALNTDGVFSNRKASGRDLYDVERVEVLFGPQSTLYASTAFGGIINVVTGIPKLDTYEMSGTFESGNYSLIRTEGMLNAPISDTFAMRTAFSTAQHDGYLTNGTDDEDIRSARVKGLYQPNEDLTIVITGQIEKAGGMGSGSVVAFKNQDDVADPWTPYSTAAGSIKNQKERKVFSNIDWDLGFGTLSLVPAYSKKEYFTRSAGLNREGVFQVTETTDKGDEKGLEARLASPEDASFKWIFGMNNYKSLYVSNSVRDDGWYRDNENKYDIKAIYGNITYPIVELFRITGGIRYTDDSNFSYQETFPDRTGGLDIEIADVKYKDPDWKIGFEYDVNENSMLFGDWSTSYRTNKGEMNNVPLPPETLDSFTVGAKNRFFGNKLQVNATAYYYDYRNYLAVGGGNMRFYHLTDLDFDGLYNSPGEAIPYMDENSGRQVGDMDLYGLDIQTSAIISDKDRLEFSLSYQKAEWKKLFFDFPQEANDLGLADLDYVGRSKPYTPTLTANAAYSHNFQLNSGATVTARVDTRYKSEVFMFWTEEDISFSEDGLYTPMVTSLQGYRTQEGYFMTNLSAIYAHPDGKWTITGYVNNVFEYAEKQSGGDRSQRIGPPRTFGAVISMRY
ncbi:TonB-dependent receptor, partial [Deltaproteobacteria bacterium]|nr:TonB-dependent receptor [Deltaproteobacteria bacterium]